MSFSLARPCPPTSPKTLTINDHGLRSIESQVAEFQLYDLRNEQQGPRPCSPPSIDPLQPLSHSPTSARTLEIAGVPVPRKPFEPINTNSGIQRATAPPRIDFTGTIKGWTTNSPPLSSPMIREQHVPPHYPFHPVNPRSSVSRSSSSSSGTLVDSPERKGSVLTLSPTMSRITANGTPMEVGPGQGNECYLGFRPHLPSRQSMGDIPSMSPLHRGSLFPPRPELPERHSSYRTVASELANPDLIDASTAPETGRIYAVKPLITKLQSQLSDALSTLHAPIRVVGILASSDSGCKMYASTLAKSSEKLGVKFELRPVEWEETDEQAGRIDKVKRVIRSVNDDREVDGLFLFLPIFDTETDKALRDMIDPQRDIEGISATSLGYSSRHPNPLSVPHNSTSIQSLQLSLPDFHPFPCTPLAVAQILRELDVYDREMRVGSRLQGKSVTVINRSQTVGKPLACLFANEGAHVYSVDVNGISMFVPNLNLTSPESTPTLAASRSILDPVALDGESCRSPNGKLPSPTLSKQSTVQGHAETGDHPNFAIYPAPQLSLDTCLSLSDVVVSAVPSPTYKVPTAGLMPGCICVNVAEHSNFEDNVNEKAKWLVPRVGGVTRLMVLFNAFDLVRTRSRRGGRAK